LWSARTLLRWCIRYQTTLETLLLTCRSYIPARETIVQTYLCLLEFDPCTGVRLATFYTNFVVSSGSIDRDLCLGHLEHERRSRYNSFENMLTDADAEGSGTGTVFVSTGLMHACEGVMKSLRSVKSWRLASVSCVKSDPSAYQSSRKRHLVLVTMMLDV